MGTKGVRGGVERRRGWSRKASKGVGRRKRGAAGGEKRNARRESESVLEDRRAPRERTGSHGDQREMGRACEPFVSGPAFAMESKPGPTCRRRKFSSANLAP